MQNLPAEGSCARMSATRWWRWQQHLAVFRTNDMMKIDNLLRVKRVNMPYKFLDFLHCINTTHYSLLLCSNMINCVHIISRMYPTRRDDINDIWSIGASFGVTTSSWAHESMTAVRFYQVKVPIPPFVKPSGCSNAYLHHKNFETKCCMVDGVSFKSIVWLGLQTMSTSGLKLLLFYSRIHSVVEELVGQPMLMWTI